MIVGNGNTQLQLDALTDSVSPREIDPALDYEAVVIGAGICGLYQIHLLTRLGIRATVLEAADGIGGNWYANRYPGCRFDSESYSYGYSFSRDLLEEWDWTELFASQPETLRYIEYVADKFDLRRHVQTGCRVQTVTFDECTDTWTVRIADGRTLTTRFILTALGLLTIPTVPAFDGRESFSGHAFHTHDWPHEGIDLRGKRVAVIGTGSSGVQTISAIADEVAELTVFQRNPNWCAPLNNRPITPAEMDEIRRRYDDVFARCRETPGGFIHGFDRRKTLDVADDERLRFWEELYAGSGFGIWLGNFVDSGMSQEANDLLSGFIAEKIRERVDDPAVAEKLIPRDHGFGTKRVPLETDYYEVYNQDNVTLVDLNETPIVRLTPDGIETDRARYDVDVIVYATGFDAVTGAFDRIDVYGRGGVKLAAKWADGPVTYLGVQTAGFPNLFMLSGPQSGSGSTNFPRGIEEICNWTTDLLQFARHAGRTRIEPRVESEQWWLAHVKSYAERMLLSTTRSWLTGHNVNLNRSDEPRYMIYTGGVLRYRRFLTEQAEGGYPGFLFGTTGQSATAPVAPVPVKTP